MLGELVRLFKQIWDADERPDARRFTVGCFVVVILALIAFSVYYGVVW